jgi:transcriptional/translational regulatory protein YebC/TACO1
MGDKKMITNKQLNSVLEHARNIGCSKRLIDNAIISGLEEDYLALDEHISEMEEYNARERARFNFVDYLAIAEESAKLVVKQMC